MRGGSAGFPVAVLGKCAVLAFAAAVSGCFGGFNRQDEEVLETYEEAVALHEAADFAGAIPLFEEALRVRPRMADAYRRLWLCHRELEHQSDGLEALERGVGVCGYNRIIAIPLAREYARLGRIEQARRLYEKLLPTNPELKEEMETLGRR